MSNARTKARAFLEQLPKDRDVTSSAGASAADNAGDDALFTKLTGSSHSSLTKTWAKEQAARDNKLSEAEKKKGSKLTAQESENAVRGMPNTTTCNGFTGMLGQAIGSTFALGQFELEDALKKAGLQDAWVPASSGKRPQTGDVFRMKKWHVGVSVDFDGDIWRTAESGQGGRRTGYDIIKRLKKPWAPDTLKGWADIDVLMDLLGSRAANWLKGWWRFEIGDRREWVFVPEKGDALGFDQAPANLKARPVGGRAGKVRLDEDDNGLTIIWTNGQDSLRQLPGVKYMLGDRAGAQIQAFKL